MSRFNTYLSEEREYGVGRTKEMTPEQFFKLTSKASVAIHHFNKTGNGIWRGHASSRAPLAFAQPSKTKPRMSRNTTNEYTLWMDNHPAWKAYPKRSESLICANSQSGAMGGAADQYLILPFNKSKIAICRDYDLWESFRDIDSLPYLNEEFRYMYFKTTNKRPDGIDKSWSSFKAALKLMDDYFDSMDYRDAIEEVVMWMGDKEYYQTPIMGTMKDTGGNVTDALEKLLDPDDSDFELITNVSKMKHTRNQEVWTDADCLMVSANFAGLMKTIDLENYNRVMGNPAVRR